jgi:hypothetical protein
MKNGFNKYDILESMEEAKTYGRLSDFTKLYLHIITAILFNIMITLMERNKE